MSINTPFDSKLNSNIVCWGILLLITVATTTLCELIGLPVAFLLGPMLAGIITESIGIKLRLSKFFMPLSQAIIGCLIAKSINTEIINTVIDQWPILMSVATMTLIASVSLGWAIGKMGIMPGTTAIWGLLPGAATTMVLIAEDFGADPRVVAFMQYLRVLLVTLIASLVARYWVHIPITSIHRLNIFAPVDLGSLAVSLIVIGISLSALLIPKLSGGVLMLSMTLGGIIQFEGFSQIQLPVWLYASAFAFIGWSVGLRFTKEVLIAATKALPQTFLCITLLIIFCIGSAAVLVYLLEVDSLSAYLGTSPGGVDSAAIIAASTKVDVSLVMALQIMRFLITLTVGPYLCKLVASYSKF